MPFCWLFQLGDFHYSIFQITYVFLCIYNCFKIKENFQKMNRGISLVVQWLRLHAPSVRGLGSISGQGSGLCPLKVDPQPRTSREAPVVFWIEHTELTKTLNHLRHKRSPELTPPSYLIKSHGSHYHYISHTLSLLSVSLQHP